VFGIPGKVSRCSSRQLAQAMGLTVCIGVCVCWFLCAWQRVCFHLRAMVLPFIVLTHVTCIQVRGTYPRPEHHRHCNATWKQVICVCAHHLAATSWLHCEPKNRRPSSSKRASLSQRHAVAGQECIFERPLAPAQDGRGRHPRGSAQLVNGSGCVVQPVQVRAEKSGRRQIQATHVLDMLWKNEHTHTRTHTLTCSRIDVHSHVHTQKDKQRQRVLAVQSEGATWDWQEVHERHADWGAASWGLWWARTIRAWERKVGAFARGWVWDWQRLMDCRTDLLILPVLFILPFLGFR